MSLLTNIVSYWKLDEASGNATDSVASNILTDTGVSRTTGIINNGGDFVAASGDYFDGGDIAGMDVGTGDFAFSLWFQTATDGDATLLAKIVDDGTTGGIAIRLRPTNTIWIFQANIAGTPVSITFDYTNGQWNHLVVTRSGSTLKSYVNGAETSSSSDSTNINNSAAFRLGRLSGAYTNYFNGQIDEVGFWSRNLTAGEVTSLYNAGAGLQYPFGESVSASDSTFLMMGV